MLIRLKEILSKSWFYRFIKLNFKYHNKIKRNLRSQLSDVKEELSFSTTNRSKVIIPLIETSHYQIFQILALAKALELRGAAVKILVCDSILPGCEIKSIRSPKVDPCLSCRHHRTKILKFFKLDFIYISEFIDSSTLKELSEEAEIISNQDIHNYRFKNIDITTSVNDSIIRYFYGAVPENNSIEFIKIRSMHLATAMLIISVAELIDTWWKPDIVFNSMNVYSAWEPFYRYFEAKKIETHTISISPFNYNAVTIDGFELYRNNKRYIKWLNDRNFGFLSNDEESALDQFLLERFSGNSKIFKESGVFDSSGPLLEHVSIDKSKRNVFLFSNIYWDVGMSESGTLFNGVVEWVIETINIFQDIEGCHLYVKPHPAEIYDGSSSLKTVRDFIFESFPELPENVTIIHPESKLKTYDLFSFIDIGLVYNGTLGLEMLLHSIPVVVCGLSPYGSLNSVTVPDSIQSYKLVLSNQIELSEINIDEVRLFAYFYFIKTMIPWTLTKSAYADNFEKFIFNSISDLKEGSDKYLDHICNSILKSESTIIESW